MSVHPCTVSVIIPSKDGKRGGLVRELLQSLNDQTLQSDEIEVVEGISPNGKARNAGIGRTTGEILVFCDDDVTLGHRMVLEQLIQGLKSHPEIGLLGASIRIPPDTGYFQKWCGRQIPRSETPIVDTFVDSDMATTQCCATTRAIINKAGQFHEGLARGVDPEFRERLRQHGYRICLAPDTWFYHPAPSSLGRLIKMGFRDGRSSAYAQMNFPDLVVDVPSDGRGTFRPQIGRFRKLVRTVGRVIGSFITGRILYFIYLKAYYTGFLFQYTIGFLKGKKACLP